MRTSIDLAKNETTVSSTSDQLNSVKRAQNRTRHQKKKIINELNESIGTVIKHTNDENIDKNIVNNTTNAVNSGQQASTVVTSALHRPWQRTPSKGKWMYERDDYLQEAIDLSVRHKDNNESDDDIVVIDTVPAAGPSGLNSVPKQDKQNGDNNNDLLLDCDLYPTLVANASTNLVIEEVMFDMNAVDQISIASDQRCETTTAATETITIDDSIDSSDDIVVESTETEVRGGEASVAATAGDYVEIIRVKYLNEPNDSDIEVLSEILSPQEVIDVMRTQLKTAQSLTHLSFTTIRLIMSKYQWNKELFVNDFFELGIERLLNHYKLVISYELKSNANKRRRLRRHSHTDSQTINGSNSTDGTPQELKTCLVCFDDFNAGELFAANCGHSLCIDCWNQYVSAHVGDRSSQEMITCPGDNCPNIVDDEELLAIIREPKTRDKYRRLISDSFVQKSPLLKWCPNGDCLHAVRVKENGFQDVECVCKTVFCFLCGDRWHEPLSCQQHQNWIQKYASQTVDSKSAKWLTKHTKCCPKCRFPIEKNGGCNYVLCLKCRHQFCYHCLGKCSHGRCLGQNLPDALQAQASDQHLKNDLHIYPTIKDQYQKQSERFAMEDKLQKDVSQKLERAVKCPEFKSALKFLKSAFTVLCHCRQTLMYSYVFGYYLMGPPLDKQVYTNNLNLLETQTEYLSTVLTTQTAVIERPQVLDIKRKVQPIYKECEAKRTQLVLHIRQGLAQNNWQFSQLSD